jgi:hypothetical protein
MKLTAAICFRDLRGGVFLLLSVHHNEQNLNVFYFVHYSRQNFAIYARKNYCDMTSRIVLRTPLQSLVKNISAVAVLFKRSCIFASSFE